MQNLLGYNDFLFESSQTSEYKVKKYWFLTEYKKVKEETIKAYGNKLRKEELEKITSDLNSLPNEQLIIQLDNGTHISVFSEDFFDWISSGYNMEPKDKELSNFLNNKPELKTGFQKAAYLESLGYDFKEWFKKWIIDSQKNINDWVESRMVTVDINGENPSFVN
jgi:hypothetical protein